MPTYPRLANYKISRQLSDKSHASVYRGETRSGQPCAIKIFHIDHEGSAEIGPEARRSFLHELEVLESTDHPNLIRLLDFGSTLDTLEDVLVLEWAEGVDFFTASQRASRAHFCEMLTQICAALDHIHTRGFIHGDLKPENLVVTGTSDPSQPSALALRLLDFSYASKPGTSPSPCVRGTPLYVAPETIKGEPPTFRSDLYSLGAILYQCLAGTPPFIADRPGSILEKHIHQQPPPIESAALGELHEVVYSLLSKDPLRRPSSSAALSQMFRDLLGDGVSPVQSQASWNAHTCFGPTVIRHDVLNNCRSLLTASPEIGSRPHLRVILICGEAGAGKTDLLRHVAYMASRLGFTIPFLTRPRIEDIKDGLSALQCQKTGTQTTKVLFAVDNALYTDSSMIREVLDSVSKEPSTLAIVIALTATTKDTDTLAFLKSMHLSSHSQTLHVQLRPLEYQQVLQALRALPGVNNAEPEVVAYITEHSGGIPKLCERILESALETNALTVKQHCLLAQPRLHTLPVPQSVQSFLAARCGAYPSSLRPFVLIFSLAKDTFSTEDLSHILTLTEQAAATAVEHLIQFSILRVVDSLTFTISSRSLARLIVSTATSREVIASHAQLATWYSSAIQRPRHHEHAADHFSASGMITEAHTHSRLAADEAVARSDYKVATIYFRRALDTATSDTNTRTTLSLGLCKALAMSGDIAEAIRGFTTISSSPDVSLSLRMRAHLESARVSSHIGHYYMMEVEARKALSIATSAAMGGEACRAKGLLGTALCRLERRTEGLPLLYRSLAEARTLGDLGQRTNSLAEIAACHWKNGAYDRALIYERRRFALFRSHLSVVNQISSLSNIGVLQTDLGLYSRARATFRHVRSYLRQVNSALWESNAGNNLGETFRIQGQWKRAIRAYRRASELISQEINVSGITIRNNIALVMVRTGNLQAAATSLRHSLRAPRSLGLTDSTCIHLNVLAQLFLSLGLPGIALKVTAHACRLAEAACLSAYGLEIGMLHALALLSHSGATSALQHLTTAIERYEKRAPFDAIKSAQLAAIQIDLALGLSPKALEYRIEPILQTVRKKQMMWHITWALILRGQGRLAAVKGEEAEADMMEAATIALKNADRPNLWKASYWLGRVFEQRLQYERALGCYRVAALTVSELAMDIEDERYREPFLAQPEVREVLARHERLRKEVGRQARHDIAAMSRSEKISRRMLNALNAIGQKLASILDLDDLLASLLDLSIENVRAERGMVFLRDEVTGEMKLACARGMDKESLQGVSTFSRSVIKQVAEGHTLLRVDVGSDPALSAFESLVIHEIKSILCVPMRTMGRTVGVIYLDTRKAAQMFTDKERVFVESFASQAAIAIENAWTFGHMRDENNHLRREIRGRSRFENLIGSTPAMQKLCESINGVISSGCNVLVVGESGTGKELVARAIHYNGPRQKRKFVALDCGALPDALLEAELFGFVRGAFTGADKDRIGLIEEAGGGTLFLDEITNTSLALQSRLLRVLQEREVRRVGENVSRQVDVRIIAATNADISTLMKEGKFRADLYYRLNVVSIEVPPLRERRDDVPLLIEHHLTKRFGDGGARKRLGPGVVEALCRYDWPGNVRELENVLERLQVLTAGSVVTLEDLPQGIRSAVGLAPSNGNGDGTYHKTGEQIMIEEALRRFAGDKAKAARYIGWNRQKLYRKMKAYGIPADCGQTV